MHSSPKLSRPLMIALAAGLLTGTAYAEEMKKDGAMVPAAAEMKKDGMMKDGMKPGAMHDGMKKDEMKDGMKKDEMKK